MSISAAIAERNVRTPYGILFSRNDHPQAVQPCKLGGDAPGFDWPVPGQASVPFVQSICGQQNEGARNRVLGACPCPESNAAGTAGDGGTKSSGLRAPVSLGDWAISQRTVMKNAG